MNRKECCDHIRLQSIFIRTDVKIFIKFGAFLLFCKDLFCIEKLAKSYVVADKSHENRSSPKYAVSEI
jgi:hypothetical protein